MSADHMKRFAMYGGAKYQAAWERHVIRVLLGYFPVLYAGNHIGAFCAALSEPQG
jgi:hypothetical protein